MSEFARILDPQTIRSRSGSQPTIVRRKPQVRTTKDVRRDHHQIADDPDQLSKAQLSGASLEPFPSRRPGRQKSRCRSRPRMHWNDVRCWFPAVIIRNDNRAQHVCGSAAKCRPVVVPLAVVGARPRCLSF